MGEFKIGDKVLIRSPYHDGKLGIVIGHQDDASMLLVELVCGTEGHDGHNFTVLGDHGETIRVPRSDKLYYYFKKHLENLGSAL